MFGKWSYILIFCILVKPTGCANGKPQNASFNSVLGDKIPQSVDQTFNINSWGLGKIERKLLTDIKTKIDSLSEKIQQGTICHFNFEFILRKQLRNFSAIERKFLCRIFLMDFDFSYCYTGNSQPRV